MAAAISLYLNLRMAIIAFSALSTFVTIFGLGNTAVNRLRVQQRMRSVKEERERIRRQVAQEVRSPRLAQASGLSMRGLVERINLFKLDEEGKSRTMLRQAGFRTQRHVYIFIVCRSVLPFVFFALTYMFFLLINNFGLGNLLQFCAAVGAFILGFYAPTIYLSNTIKKRQNQIRRYFPDALDLLLICIEAGQSIEVAFNRVASEFASDASILAEEFTVTTAELSYLQDRRRAFENMGNRIGLPHVKTICSGLIQSEIYGTSLSQVLRTMAQESRNDRFSAAEKKAAALPPKLTVPMIIFFLPGLLVVVLGPAIIGVVGNF